MMNQQLFTTPLPLRDVKVTDEFWQREMELVRREVIPYQWEALNDRVPDAAPSYCMHNFRAAARLMARRKLEGTGVQSPYTIERFEQLPEDPRQPNPDHFYGFVFQDTDFSKWIEAVGYSLTTHPDPTLEEIADGAIDLVCAAQAEDGYLDTCYILGGMDKRFTNLRDHHELYCLGHLTEGAIAYYQATGKDKLLKAACRFADFVETRLGREEGKLRGYPGHEIAEMALLRLYEVTGEERYKKLACYFIDERGQQPNYFNQEVNLRLAAEGKKPVSLHEDTSYHQAHKPVREQDEAVGHAVRAMYLYSGMADAARLNQDEALFAACERLWNSTVREKLYITGGVGGTVHGEAFSHPFDLPSDSAYSETCAAIGLAFFARRMLQIGPDSRYADVMEQALYNTVLSGMALDGKSFFYVNPLEVVPEATHRDARLHHVKSVRQKWFGCACCPPNIARIVSSVGAYAYTANDKALYTHLYVSGEVSAALSGTPVTLKVSSQLPWQGHVEITVCCDAPAQGTLAFRLPGWCKQPRVTCSAGKAENNGSGYACITACWQQGDTVTLDFPMEARILRADHRVRETEGQVAVMRGPIAYCGEQADNGENLHLYRIHPSQAQGRIACRETDVFGHTVTVLDVPAARVTVQDGALYSDWQEEREESATLTLVPYYCWANRGEGEMRVWWHA